MKRCLTLIVVATILFSCGGKTGVKSDDGGDQVKSKRVLGKEQIEIKEPLGKKYTTIVIPDFSFENTNIQQVDKTKHPDFDVTVHKLGTSIPDQIAAHLKEWKVFNKVIRVKKLDKTYPDAVALKARFTTVTSGNRALRFWVGFGAGSSTVGVDGQIIDASSKNNLARFLQNRHSPASMGDYHIVFESDGKNLAKDIARFIQKLY